MKIVIATNNMDKLAELRSLLEPTGCVLISMAEVGFTDEIAEKGASYHEMPISRPRRSLILRCPVLADDTGYQLIC